MRQMPVATSIVMDVVSFAWSRAVSLRVGALKHTTGTCRPGKATDAKPSISGGEFKRDEGRGGRYTCPPPRTRRRDVMGAYDPAEAVEVLDLLLKFFGD